MRVSDMIASLNYVLAIEGDLEIEIATSEDKDEWYEVIDCSVESNYRGNTVMVINTD